MENNFVKVVEENKNEKDKDKVMVEEEKDKDNNQNEYQGLTHSLEGQENSSQEKTFQGGQKSHKISENSNSLHKLNSIWCFWYASRKQKDHDIPYSNRLKKFAEFSTVEDFFKFYVFLKSASEIDRNTDISMFKVGFQPLWESCPNSGCLFIRFKKNDDPIEMDLLWEKLLFSLIGEQFDEQSILGTTLSIRGRETIIELWFDFNKNENLKSSIGSKIKDILNLTKNGMVYFKDNSLSLQDKSTLKNAESYNFSKRKNTYY